MLQRFMNWLAENTARFYLLATLVTLLGMAAAYLTIEPAPDNHLVISAGREDGTYYRFAQRYSGILARDGVELRVLASEGLLENLQRLRDPESKVDLAFVQGGVAGETDAGKLAPLASVYFEPIWFFYRAEVVDEIGTIVKMKGQRLAVGDEGSGTRLLVTRLMRENGLEVTARTALPLGGGDAARALINRRIDGAFFIASPSSPTLRALCEEPKIRLMSFERAAPMPCATLSCRR